MAQINKPSQPLVPPTDIEDVEGIVNEAIASDTTHAPLVNDLVPAVNLPSYVDDVLEFNSVELFPNPGEEGKIYVALDTNYTYRWAGSVYTQVGGSEVDLSDYYRKEEVNELLDEKADAGSVYTTKEIDYKFLGYYNSSEINSMLEQKASAAELLDAEGDIDALEQTAEELQQAVPLIVDVNGKINELGGGEILERTIIGHGTFKEFEPPEEGSYTPGAYCSYEQIGGEKVWYMDMLEEVYHKFLSPVVLKTPSYIILHNNDNNSSARLRLTGFQSERKPTEISVQTKNTYTYNGTFLMSGVPYNITLTLVSNNGQSLSSDIGSVPLITPTLMYWALDNKADVNSVYTKAEVDSAIAAAIGDVLNTDF